CQLSDIIKYCLRFTITHAEIRDLREKIIDWVKTYERYYYQYAEDRLCACTLTIHGLLHQLGARYDLEDELSSVKKSKSGLSASEYAYEEYPQAILRLPYKKNYTPDQHVRKQVMIYLSALLAKRQKDLVPFIPQIMPSFGKVRILDGDSIRSVSACGDGSVAERNMSFIRYEIQTRRTVADAWVSQISYGRLERILVCVLPKDKILGPISGKKRLLAVITPCKNTHGRDASLEITTYRGMGTSVVTDLQSVVAVVG
ncbi:hypothetical protein DFH09DRAFT_839222, partial [Mycena vulgaris]